MECLKHSDFDCPICLSLLIYPLTTPCNHTFCRHCIEELFDLSASGSIPCPICRTVLPNIQILRKDDEKANYIDTNFKTNLENRKNDLDSFLIKYISCRFFIGNKHAKLNTNDTNQHKWTLFVEFENSDQISNLVEKIVVSLHPTFSNPIVTLTHPPFEITRIGWGVFLIPIKIYWKAWTGLGITEHSHYLSFDEEGAKAKSKVKIEREKFEKNSKKASGENK